MTTASFPLRNDSFASLSQSELTDVLKRIAHRNPKYEPFLGAALERAVKNPPHTASLETYLQLLAFHALADERRGKHRRSICLTDLSHDDTEPDFPDPQAEREFNRAELCAADLPLEHLEWLQLARANLTAKFATGARNKFGRAEKQAWDRRLRILDLFVLLAEHDEYDEKTNAVIEWMRESLAAQQIDVEPQTIANDISIVREVVAEFVAYCAAKRQEHRSRK